MTNRVTTFCAHAAGARAGWLLVAFTLVSAMLLGAAPPASAQLIQQGGKLVGSNYVGAADEGWSVALSADGNTAIVGAPDNNSASGAAWVFTRNDGVWAQQADLGVGWSVALSADGNTAIVGTPYSNSDIGGASVFTRSNGVWTQQTGLLPLVGSGASGSSPTQGFSVALSADGNTAIVGGPNDDCTPTEEGCIEGIGAAWIFIRSGGTWSQQGSKLVGTGYSGTPGEGHSVALSADGNTALIGGETDDASTGAAWVFTRSGGSWTQQGAKLVGSSYSGTPGEGYSVALSSDGSTAMVGGWFDNSGVGAAWIFSRNSNTFTQQGGKLTGGEESGSGNFGTSVALSSDGSTAIVGGDGDNSGVGAAWVFSRNSSTFTQQGGKLTGGEESGNGNFGNSVALSSDGNTLIVGGDGDNGYVGAAWVFTRAVPTSTHDFDDDGVSDILWKDTSGDVALWLMSGGQESSGATLGNVGTSWSVAATRDFNDDGDADILWSDGSGDLGLWLMDGGSVGSYASLGNVGTQWSVVGTGDFNGNGTGDILWRNGSTGDVAIWLMRNGAFSSGVDLGTVPSVWTIAGTGDFNADGTTDILWRNTANGELAIWFMSNGQLSSSLNVGRVSTDWSVVGTGDFNGDGVSDILWRDSEGDLAIWLMNNSGQEASGTTFSGIPTTWSVAETGDFDGNGTSDILWLDQSGDLGVWLMDGLTVSSALGLGNVGTTWKVQGQNAD